MEKLLDLEGVFLGGKFIGARRDEPEDVFQGRLLWVAGSQANVGKGEREVRAGKNRVRAKEKGASMEG
jgi:hypothetical protein